MSPTWCVRGFPAAINIFSSSIGKYLKIEVACLLKTLNKQVFKLVKKPDFREKLECDLALIQSKQWIIGIDEVGLGAFAGDMYLGATAINRDLLVLNDGEILKLAPVLSDITDSKEIVFKKRDKIWNALLDVQNITSFLKIKTMAAPVSEINQSLTKAYLRAFDALISAVIKELKVTKDEVSIVFDGSRKIKGSQFEHSCLVKGDRYSLSIGCASIAAKVTRDRYMVALSLEYPGYEFEKNKGYCSNAHVEGLVDKGLTPIHRTQYVNTYFKGRKKS